MKVVVAEDSSVMRCLLVSYLSQWDYEIFEAEDGEQAWQLYREHDVPLVLTDWMMPRVDGLELIRRIRSSRQTAYCYLILLTSKSEKEALVTAMEAGADDFLVKPCDEEELRVRLREGERIIRLERELAEQNRQLRETQAALVQSEKLASLGQLAAGMAHEINNPLAFVTNNLAVLRRDLGAMVALVEKYQQARGYLDHAPEPLLEDLRELEEDCDLAWLREHLPQLLNSSAKGLSRVRDIIMNLRDFARLDQAAYESLDLRQAIRSTLEVLRHAINQKQLQVSTVFAPAPKLHCRPDKINQMLYNVLLNAIQASDEGGALAIRLRVIRLNSEAESIRLEVQDHGKGMDQATADRVFEPFFTTKPVGTGTGLGMAVSYGIVRDHGGVITIHSQPGEGTRVEIDLPLPAPSCPEPLAALA